MFVQKNVESSEPASIPKAWAKLAAEKAAGLLGK
jgi:hypothetical protein